jgi:hypothetical protein
MRTNPKTPAVPARHQAALDEILKYQGARAAFERLCAEGLDCQRLTVRVLALRSGKPSRKRALFVDRSKCRRLSMKLAALADEFDNGEVMNWCRTRREPQVMKKPQPAIILDLLGDTLHEYFQQFDPKPHVRFDAKILCDQLRAGAREVETLGGSRRPIAWAVQVNDMYLRQLVDDVKTYTKTNHYKEIALLCEAATGGRQNFDPDALKQAAHRRRKP